MNLSQSVCIDVEGYDVNADSYIRKEYEIWNKIIIEQTSVPLHERENTLLWV